MPDGTFAEYNHKVCNNAILDFVGGLPNKENDYYEAVAWYYNDPDAPVEIIPIANCALDGPLRPLPQGGSCGTLRFSRTLNRSDSYFFAYETRFNSEAPCRPTGASIHRGSDRTR